MTETAVIAPVCRNMPRSPATTGLCSGASWRVALLAAGVEMPMPIPLSAAPAASQAYGVSPAAGLADRTSRPAAVQAKPATIGRR